MIFTGIFFHVCVFPVFSPGFYASSSLCTLLLYEKCCIFDQILNVCLSGSSLPFIGPAPALGISTEIARGVIRGWTSRKHSYWQSIYGQRQAKGFLKRPFAKRTGELLNLNRNQLRVMMGLLTGHSFKRASI
jgi:hypothetical protein